MTPIHVDIRDMLKQSNVDEALPHIGTCRYTAPCIVGTVVPKDLRANLDGIKDADGDQHLNVATLLACGHVTAPEEQLGDIKWLQTIFDLGVPERFNEAVEQLRRKYGVEA